MEAILVGNRVTVTLNGQRVHDNAAIDGITGGYNFQVAWTTGWIAGHAMAGVTPQRTARTATAG